jgi:hypothetical protein
MWRGLAVVVAAGCDGGAVECTAEARGSVNVTVTDAAGAPIPDVEVSFETPSRPLAPCEQMVAGDWVCGWEVAGEISVVATAPGYVGGSATVTVGADECHVVPEVLTLVLEPIQ